MAAPLRSTFTTSDPERAHALMSAAYGDNRLRVSGDASDFHLHQGRWDLGQVVVDEFSTTLSVEWDAEMLDQVWICRVLRSSIDIEVERVGRRHGVGEVFVSAPPGVGCHTVFMGSLVVVGLEPSVFAEVTGEETFDPMSQLRLDAMPPDRARNWRLALDYVTHTVLANPEAAANPLIVGSAQRMLAAIALHGYDNGPTENTDTHRHATPAAVRRAIAFIEANPDLDISVADIARAAHVSVRSLQMAFRRHLDTAPLRYLRRVRLDLVHTDLHAAQPGDDTTVTATAMRWGYADLSRFAADYRAAYGEPPHATLRRTEN